MAVVRSAPWRLPPSSGSSAAALTPRGYGHGAVGDIEVAVVGKGGQQQAGGKESCAKPVPVAANEFHQPGRAASAV